MTIQNAEEARALSERGTWNLEKLLTVIEDAAETGERHVFTAGRLPDDLYNELIIRGFQVVDKEPDTEIRW